MVVGYLLAQHSKSPRLEPREGKLALVLLALVLVPLYLNQLVKHSAQFLNMSDHY
jgi:hypothetical protein